MCAVVDVPAGEARRFPVEGREVAVINLGDDGFRALDAVCSHEHFFLDEGEVDPEEGDREEGESEREAQRGEGAKHGNSWAAAGQGPRRTAP